MLPRDPFLISPPTFPRLDEYAGVWAIEPSSAGRMIDMFRSLDFAKHMSGFGDNRPPVGPVVTRVPAKGGKSIAVVPVIGMLMKQRSSTGGTSTVALQREIRNATNDSTVSGILLSVDSPGGTTAGTMALADEVRRASRRKPTWAQVEDSAYSAAYWVASQAEQIFASVPTAGLANIGAYLAISTDRTSDGKAAYRVFRSSPLKGAGIDEITDEHAAEFQKQVDHSHMHFVNAVRTGRGLSNAAVNEVADGRAIYAQEAKDKRLIDGIRSLESTLAAMAAL